jgi:hypothetical protein
MLPSKLTCDDKHPMLNSEEKKLKCCSDPVIALKQIGSLACTSVIAVTLVEYKERGEI